MGAASDATRVENSAAFNRVVSYVMRLHRAYAPHYFDDVFAHSKAEDGLIEIESHKRRLDIVL